MAQRLRFLLQQIWYDLRTGLLLRPALITFCLAVLGPLLIFLEDKTSIGSSWKIIGPLIFHGESSSAQSILSIIAGAMLTMVSIVYSILVMALTLASMQFSPRILHEFMRDRTSQTQLGMFIGTFTYCLMILRTIDSDLKECALQLATSVAIILALICLGHLIYFIHHISQFIQINYIVDLIAGQTDEVIDSIYPENIAREGIDTSKTIAAATPQGAVEIKSKRSGYIQLIDEEDLIKLSKEKNLCITVLRGVGDFAIEGNALMAVHSAEELTPEIYLRCLEAFDIGPVRTMQQDIEFGIRQIVDVALKAISPAVNDPTTAVTCIDQLGRILSKLSNRRISDSRIIDGENGNVLLVMKRTTFESALELAVAQISQYGKCDMAVMTALMKLLVEISSRTTFERYRTLLLQRAEILTGLADKNLSETESRDFNMWRHRLEEKYCPIQQEKAECISSNQT